MTRALLLACGNPLRGDDGLGGWLATKVQEQSVRQTQSSSWTVLRPLNRDRFPVILSKRRQSPLG